MLDLGSRMPSGELAIFFEDDLIVFIDQLDGEFSGQRYAVNVNRMGNIALDRRFRLGVRNLHRQKISKALKIILTVVAILMVCAVIYAYLFG